MADKKIVLVVDDMAENLTLMRSMLKDYFDVRLAKSAKIALALLENTEVDLVFLDIEMPGMTGFGFMEHYREARKEVGKRIAPVIFVTSHADTELVTKAVNMGGKDYLVKPIKADVLLKKIDGIIGLPAEKVVAHPLDDKLHAVLAAVSAGDAVHAEATVKDLAQAAANQTQYIRSVVDEIAGFIAKFEYDKAIQRIHTFMDYLSANMEKQREKEEEERENRAKTSNLWN